jgi:hypothetical protein
MPLGPNSYGVKDPLLRAFIRNGPGKQFLGGIFDVLMQKHHSADSPATALTAAFEFLVRKPWRRLAGT